ncbi:MAG: NAD(P)H-dependent oxidoreductase [Undibacterium sp.]|nr:NAD(P)H-dependent oxidoreductase [Opitutaceae bacterium]
MNAATLLHLDASPRGARSHSRQLGREFVATWQASHPTGLVVIRDLAATPPPFVSEPWVEGAFTPPAGHSPAAQAAMTISNAYVDELLAATEIVITTPLYNLSIPAVLKAWIDQIVRFGRTFEKAPQGFNGLVTGKKVRVLVASGSDFRPAMSGGGYNFLEPYLRAVLGFIGLTEVEFVYAHSLSQSPDVSAEAITAAIAASRKLAAA